MPPEEQDESQDLDAALDRALEEGAPDNGQTPGTDPEREPRPQSETEGEPIKVAGRTYKTVAEALRAHDTLFRHTSKLERDLKDERAKSERWKKLEETYKDDPEMYAAVKKAADEYAARKKAGQTEAQAKAGAGVQGVPKEILDKIARHDKFVSDGEQRAANEALDREVADFRKAHPEAKDADVDAVLDRMRTYAEEKNLDVPMEVVWASMRQRESTEKVAQAKAELERVKAHADVGAPNGGTAPPARRKSIREMSDDEFERAMDRGIEKHGLGATP